ncbi:MAG TPA: hypothetical protein VI027_11285 [Rubrobacteraceae bacterium]
MRSRPQTVTVAAILFALFSVPNLLFPLWAEAIPREEEVPALVVYTTVLVGVAGLVGAAGLWMLRKWSLWLTIVVCVLNVLDAAAGVVGAPNAALQVAATVMVVGFALIIVLVVLPTSRRALAAGEQSSRVR